MHTTVILCHPATGSFNHAVASAVCAAAEKRGDAVTLIDLYRDCFDPALSAGDLALYLEGRSSDELVARYNKILETTENAVFVFPIWWYDAPAMLRGFFDKVMLPGSAYTGAEVGLTPLRHIEKSLVLTTSSAKTSDLTGLFGDPIGKILIPHTMRMVGFLNGRWANLGEIDTATPAQREEFLRVAAALV